MKRLKGRIPDPAFNALEAAQNQWPKTGDAIHQRWHSDVLPRVASAVEIAQRPTGVHPWQAAIGVGVFFLLAMIVTNIAVCYFYPGRSVGEDEPSEYKSLRGGGSQEDDEEEVEKEEEEEKEEEKKASV